MEEDDDEPAAGLDIRTQLMDDFEDLPAAGSGASAAPRPTPRHPSPGQGVAAPGAATPPPSPPAEEPADADFTPVAAPPVAADRRSRRQLSVHAFFDMYRQRQLDCGAACDKIEGTISILK